MRNKFLLILTLMLLMGAAGARAQEAYAYFSSSDGSLNFCYDNNRSYYKSNGYPTFDLNTGSNTPAWYSSYASKVKELYFMSKFANYRPTTCYRWADGMYNLTKITNIGYLNTSSVTNMREMFYGCEKLTSIDLSGFKTTNVTLMNDMFNGCKSLTSLNLSSFNTAKVTNMRNMFAYCFALTSVDLSSFNTSSVTNMERMFFQCEKLENLDLRGFNTLQVTSLADMF